jgi:hypothetical protein
MPEYEWEKNGYEKIETWPGEALNTCNPYYLGGIDLEDQIWRSTQAKS